MSSSYGVTTGSKPDDAIDRGVKGTPWDAVQVGSVVCTIWLNIFLWSYSHVVPNGGNLDDNWNTTKYILQFLPLVIRNWIV